MYAQMRLIQWWDARQTYPILGTTRDALET